MAAAPRGAIRAPERELAIFLAIFPAIFHEPRCLVRWRPGEAAAGSDFEAFRSRREPLAPRPQAYGKPR
jgi:hypothetical protein